MKKFKIIVFAIIFTILLGNIDVFASTKTFTRSEDNYLVKDGVVVTESNKWNVLNTPAIDATEKVYDFAELLSEFEENTLYANITSFSNETGYDFAVATISDNVKTSAKVYAEDFYDYNDFSNDGFLFLIDMDTREIYLLTTGDAIPILPDYKADLILDSVYQKVAAGKYYEVCSTVISSVRLYATSSGNNSSYVGSNGTEAKTYRWDIIFGISGLVTLVTIIIMICSNNMVHKATSAKEYLIKDTMRVQKISDIFMGSHVSKTRISSDSSTSRSSSGGGHISTSHGSSGISHGGGGHKF